MILRASPCVALVVLVTTGTARGETKSIRLEYTAPNECPVQKEFEDELRARTSKVALGGDGRRFSVSVERTEAGFAGRLAIVELDGRQNERALDGASCVDVVSSLALVAALAIDPDASTVPRAELPPAPPPPAEPKPKPEPEPKPPRARIETRPEPAPAPPPERLHSGAGLGVALVQGPAPVMLVALGPEVFVEHFRLGLLAAQTGIIGPSDEQSTFRWLVARPGVCPFGLEGTFRALPCVIADLGVVQAEGRDVDEPQSATRFWADLGLAGRVGYASGSFHVDLELGLFLPLTRDDFVFEKPRIVVHDVPALGESAGIYLGFEVP